MRLKTGTEMEEDMDFTVIIVGLLIGIGIPLRNKAIKEHRKKREQRQPFSKTDKEE